jgi:cytochrome c
MKSSVAAWAVVLLCTAGSAAASEKIAAASGCVACHAAAKKLVGPSYKEIAARYKGQADAPALLAERIRKGSKGVWGAAPMPPTPAARLSDADLKAVVAWVLKTP